MLSLRDFFPHCMTQFFFLSFTHACTHAHAHTLTHRCGARINTKIKYQADYSNAILYCCGLVVSLLWCSTTLERNQKPRQEITVLILQDSPLDNAMHKNFLILLWQAAQWPWMLSVWSFHALSGAVGVSFGSSGFHQHPKDINVYNIFPPPHCVSWTQHPLSLSGHYIPVAKTNTVEHQICSHWGSIIAQAN